MGIDSDKKRLKLMRECIGENSILMVDSNQGKFTYYFNFKHYKMKNSINYKVYEIKNVFIIYKYLFTSSMDCERGNRKYESFERF